MTYAVLIDGINYNNGKLYTDYITNNKLCFQYFPLQHYNRLRLSAVEICDVEQTKFEQMFKYKFSIVKKTRERRKRKTFMPTNEIGLTLLLLVLLLFLITVQ